MEQSHEKLIVAQLAKTFPSFYGTRRFITVFTTACHWTLSWSGWSSPHPHTLFKVYVTIYCYLQCDTFLSGFTTI